MRATGSEPTATHSHPLQRAESGVERQSVSSRCLLHPENVVYEQSCARHPQPGDHDLNTDTRLDVDAVDEHCASHLELGLEHE
jgi:hypothetical protein